MQSKIISQIYRSLLDAYGRDGHGKCYGNDGCWALFDKAYSRLSKKCIIFFKTAGDDCVAHATGAPLLFHKTKNSSGVLQHLTPWSKNYAA
jgi:hypothetical protein